jgi:16S rRNA (guanine966-N2)-methyltransferase
MKIAGGEFKGRVIKVPAVPDLRPSTERIREAIFSVIGADIINAQVADLFCGSGALGLEALSRGAAHALFVDSNRAVAAIVRQNIKRLSLLRCARVINMNVFDIRPGHVAGMTIIFADPPYGKEYCRRLASLLSLQKFAWNGILALEHESDWQYDGAEYSIVRRLDFGDSSASFLMKSPSDSQHEKGELTSRKEEFQ